jgi:solute carrier family 35 protein E1
MAGQAKTLWIVAVWYVASVLFNIFAKIFLTPADEAVQVEVLEALGTTIISTCAMFSISAILVYVCESVWEYDTSLRFRFEVTVPTILHLFGTFAQTFGVVLVAVSSVHSIKAMEPLMSLLLNRIFFGKWASGLEAIPPTIITVVGVFMTSSAEHSQLAALGVISSLACALCFSLRNVIVKAKWELPSNTASKTSKRILFMDISATNAMLTLPFALAAWFSGMYSATLGWQQVYLLGFWYFAYNYASFFVLSQMSMLAHALINCMKRVVIILSSILIVGTRNSLSNYIGISWAVIGISIFSLVKSNIISPATCTIASATVLLVTLLILEVQQEGPSILS